VPARGLFLSIDYSVCFSVQKLKHFEALLLHCALNPVDVSYLISFRQRPSLSDKVIRSLDKEEQSLSLD